MLFKDRKYEKASKRYEKGVKNIEYDNFFSEEEKKQVNVLKVSCNLNNAAYEALHEGDGNREHECEGVV